jgi:hypothetical protein
LKPLTGNEFSGWRLFPFWQAKEYSQAIDYADAQKNILAIAYECVGLFIGKYVDGMEMKKR